MNSKILSLAERHLLKKLIDRGQSVVTYYTFYRLMQAMHKERKGLYLRNETPTVDDHFKYLRNMCRDDVIRPDNDYGKRLIRVLDIPGQSTEEVVCTADPLCYVSHLSSMHRWGLTNRSPKPLICTRPDRISATAQLSEIMTSHPDGLPPERLRMKCFGHPDKVRNRTVTMVESKKAGASINIRGTGVRIATIGQTFLDMLLYPKLCGGMSHVLDVYDEHADAWLEEIVDSVDSVSINLVKSRAGYILEERLGLRHKKIESWKVSAQRGGSRKLDPSKDYAPNFSETWMISLNV